MIRLGKMESLVRRLVDSYLRHLITLSQMTHITGNGLANCNVCEVLICRDGHILISHETF